jgi:hypothetical protein
LRGSSDTGGLRRIAAADRRTLRDTVPVIDSGLIRGGFATDYDARIIPGQNTPVVQAIAVTTGTNRDPKIEIEFQKRATKPRIYSFDGTVENSSLFTTPNSLIVGFTTSESYLLYLINTNTHSISEVPISTPATCAVSDLANGRLFVGTSIDVVAIGESGFLWRSKRVSLDGIKMLVFSGDSLSGFGTRIGGGSIKFSIDPASGETVGGFDFRQVTPGLWFAP